MGLPPTKGSTMTVTAPADRRLPWDAMGSALETPAPTVAAALEATGLDYKVEVRDLYSARRIETLEGAATMPADAAHDRFLHAPDLRTIVRPMPDGTERVLAAVGRRFTPIPNADAFSVADLLVQEFGATISGVADYRSGGASLLALDLNRPVVVEGQDGRDETAMHLLVKNAHDGSGALTFALTGVRLRCTNALQAAIKGASRVWKISHTPNAQERVNLAHQSIIRALAYQDAFQAQAQAMMDATMMDVEFDRIVAGLWREDGNPESRKSVRARDIQAEVKGIYHSSETLEGARGTLWGGYNAITEWYDWGRRVNNGDAARAEGSLEGAAVRHKESVWDRFAAAV